MIRITSRKHLFRRCGVAHPKGPVDYPDDQFTKEQLKVLRAEPMLKVEIAKSKEQGAKRNSQLLAPSS